MSTKCAHGRQQQKKIPGHEALSSRVRALYDRFGHYGPFCAGEVEAVAAMPSDPKPPRHPDLLEAEFAHAAAVQAFVELDEEWREAVRALRAFERENPGGAHRLTSMGQVVADSRLGKQLAKLEARQAEAWEAREDSQKARVRANRRIQAVAP